MNITAITAGPASAHTREECSDTIRVDPTAPQAGAVEIVTDTNSFYLALAQEDVLTVGWDIFQDDEADNVDYRVELVDEQDTILDSTEFQSYGDGRAQTFTNTTIQHGKR